MSTKTKDPSQVSINMDTTPILYTDNINISVNKDGATLDVMQRIGKNKLRIVSRIGMSRSHAKEFVEKFGKLLIMTAGGTETGKKTLS